MTVLIVQDAVTESGVLELLQCSAYPPKADTGQFRSKSMKMISNRKVIKKKFDDFEVPSGFEPL